MKRVTWSLLIDEIIIKWGVFPANLLYTANRLAQQLEKDGLSAAAIHGNKSQGARTRAFAGQNRSIGTYVPTVVRKGRH